MKFVSGPQNGGDDLASNELHGSILNSFNPSSYGCDGGVGEGWTIDGGGWWVCVVSNGYKFVEGHFWVPIILVGREENLGLERFFGVDIESPIF